MEPVKKIISLNCQIKANWVFERSSISQPDVTILKKNESIIIKGN